MVGGWSIRNAVGSVRGALGSVRPSEWATAGTLTVEVLVRGVPDLLLGAADLSPLAASVLINTTVGDPAALVVLNTLFLGTVFYTFLPDVLPARVAVVTDRPLRLTLAAGSAAVAFPAVVRPPGYSVPAAVPLSLCGLVTEVGSVTRVAVSASGLLVPVALVAVGWSVRETLRREPQPAATDRRALPVAFCLTFYAAAVALVGTEFGLVYLGPVVLVWLYYLEPAQDRGAGPVERMRNVFWYVLAIWVVLLAASTVVPTPPIIRYLPGGVVVLAAVGYLVERYAATGSQP